MMIRVGMIAFWELFFFFFGELFLGQGWEDGWGQE